MDKETLLKYRIGDLRELLQEKLEQQEDLHSPEIIQLSHLINILVNEYYRLPKDELHKTAL